MKIYTNLLLQPHNNGKLPHSVISSTASQKDEEELGHVLIRGVSLNISITISAGCQRQAVGFCSLLEPPTLAKKHIPN